MSHDASFTGAFSPTGDSLYIAVARTIGAGRFDNWELCPTPPPPDTIFDLIDDAIVRECRPHIHGIGTDSTWVYGVDVRTGHGGLLWINGSAAMQIWSVTEDGKESVVREERSQSSERTHFYLYQPPDKPYWEMRWRDVPFTSTRECDLEYRNPRTGALAFVAVSRRPCAGLRIDGSGAASTSPAARP